MGHALRVIEAQPATSPERQRLVEHLDSRKRLDDESARIANAIAALKRLADVATRAESTVAEIETAHSAQLAKWAGAGARGAAPVQSEIELSELAVARKAAEAARAQAAAATAAIPGLEAELAEVNRWREGAAAKTQQLIFEVIVSEAKNLAAVMRNFEAQAAEVRASIIGCRQSIGLAGPAGAVALGKVQALLEADVAQPVPNDIEAAKSRWRSHIAALWSDPAAAIELE